MYHNCSDYPHTTLESDDITISTSQMKTEKLTNLANATAWFQNDLTAHLWHQAILTSETWLQVPSYDQYGQEEQNHSHQACPSTSFEYFHSFPFLPHIHFFRPLYCPSAVVPYSFFILLELSTTGLNYKMEEQ